MNTYWERLIQVLLDIFTHNLSYWTIQFLCEVFSFTGKMLSLLENNRLPQILHVANNMWQGDFFFFF